MITSARRSPIAVDILNEVNTVLLREEHTLPEVAYGHRAGQAGNVSHSVCWTQIWQEDAAWVSMFPERPC